VIAPKAVHDEAMRGGAGRGYPSCSGGAGVEPQKNFENLIDKSCILKHSLTTKRELEKV
jgi:hypothetical protein